ncbi:hypothetical protein [Curtobacterium herbarum]|uniref:Uncharacterized protein n=1 Tax=Curtobacterium herbarum TaxID=150122 RepID=A0ABP4K4U6_9MICO|nr:hypothetical protein [Curtobacterium herbarum]MBM7475494.1 hypothetical protein [Curtobacterium herbarum]MCS6543410.1 hypothetical protein [Curtobacterium herbarum]
MFGRRAPRPAAPDDPAGAVPPDVPVLGIGAVVRVVPSDRGDQWADDPIGLIVAPGGAQLAGYAGAGVRVAWVVEFDEPAWTTDGRGPFERATVQSRQLVPVPMEPETVDAGAS